MTQNTFDPHEILEIPASASRPEIERAYYLARLAYSSDSLASYSLYSPAEKSKILERVERAYKVLMNQETLSGSAAQAARPSARPGFSESEAAPGNSGRPGDPGHAREGAPMAPVSAPAPAGPEEARTVPRARGPLQPLSGGPQIEASDVSRPYDAVALRKVRKSRGMQLQEISLRTKISLKNLRSIESGGYDDLPPIVYLKGYLVEYAKCLRLNPLHVTLDFLEAAARTDSDEAGASGKYE